METNNLGVHIDWEVPSDGMTILGHDILADLCFADDETLVARNVNDLQDMLDRVVRDLAKVGLKVSVSKTEWMGVNVGESWHLFLDGILVPRKGSITLLGSTIRCDGDVWPELTARVNKAWNYYFTFRYIFENKYVAFGKRINVWEKNGANGIIMGFGNLQFVKCPEESFGSLPKPNGREDVADFP